MSDAPFFVVGTGRCGSSMLRRILRDHPALVVPNETHWLSIMHERFGLRPAAFNDLWTIAKSVRTARGKRMLDRILEEEALDESNLLIATKGDGALLTWAEFHQRFGDALAAHRNKPRWGDKTPDYGFFMDTLRGAWPEARFVHVVRDGRACALSMMEVPSFRRLVDSKQIDWRHLALSDTSLDGDNGGDCVDYFALWRARIQRIEAQQKLLSSNQLMIVRYEGLLADPSAVLNELARFLGVDSPAEWLDNATGSVRPDNSQRRRVDPRFTELSHRFADDIKGFEQRYGGVEL